MSFDVCTIFFVRRLSPGKTNAAGKWPFCLSISCKQRSTLTPSYLLHPSRSSVGLAFCFERSSVVAMEATDRQSPSFHIIASSLFNCIPCPTTSPLVPVPLRAKKSSLRPKNYEPFNCHHLSKSPQLQMHPPRQYETKRVHFPS